MQKNVDIPGIGEVLLVKRRGTRGLRLSIQGNKVRISLPPWLPYQSAVAFALSKQQWINQHRQPARIYQPGELIGKAHRLNFVENVALNGPRSRVTPTEIRLSHPPGQRSDSPAVQTAVHRAALRALKQEGEAVLPGHIRRMAAAHGFDFRSVSLKRLKSRWGSCDHQQNIVLNTFLMSLPWPLIDYVLMHELTHTKHLHHGADFWGEFLSHMPDAKQRRRQLKAFSPYL